MVTSLVATTKVKVSRGDSPDWLVDILGRLTPAVVCRIARCAVTATQITVRQHSLVEVLQCVTAHTGSVCAQHSRAPGRKAAVLATTLSMPHQCDNLATLVKIPNGTSYIFWSLVNGLPSTRILKVVLLVVLEKIFGRWGQGVTMTIPNLGLTLPHCC